MDVIDLSKPTNMDAAQFRGYLVPIVQKILDKEFPNDPVKRRMRLYPDRINFACPVCGDSANNSTKKRGNIILRGRFANLYKCHNCGASMSIMNFLKRYDDIHLSLDAIGYISQKKFEPSQFGTGDVVTNGGLFNIEEIESICPDRETLKSSLHLVECGDANNPNKGRSYLIKRMQFDFRRFLYSIDEDKLYVLNLTPNGKIFGMQVRVMSEKLRPNEQKYKSYNITNVRRMVYGGNDDEETINYDSLSLLFNALLVNFDKPIIVTEGPMDSFLIPNAIALCGGGKHIPLDVRLYYLFDYDEPGMKYAIEALKEHDDVFMWKKFAEDLNLPKRKKWDWNDLVMYASNNGIRRFPPLHKYFTNEPLDIINL